jgi:hypothetical protein
MSHLLADAIDMVALTFLVRARTRLPDRLRPHIWPLRPDD